MMNRVMKSLVILLALFCSNNSYAQRVITPENMEKLHIMEDSLIITADSMYNALIPDTHIAYCERFVKQLVRALKIENAYLYGFDSLKGYINILQPEDKSFKLFNWSVNTSEVTRRYYGAIQMDGEQLKLYPLVDHSTEMGKNLQDTLLDNFKWYGALYYRVITHEVDGEKVYTLFGLNSASPISNKKILEPMVINPQGIVFGKKIFNMSSKDAPAHNSIYRFVLEYKKDVQVSMNWDDELKHIYFDRLVSQVNDPNRKYTYVPSGQYDGFKWGDGQWNYMPDLIPVLMLKDGEAPSGDKPSR